MGAALTRTMRILAPNDLRLIWRDGFLLLVIFMLPLACVGFRWLIPYLTQVLAPWVQLEAYYPIVLGFMIIGQQPVMLGVVIGLLFIEERDQGTLLAIQATPLSLRSFVTYRMIAAMAISVLTTTAAVPLSGLVSLTPVELLSTSALASLSVPPVALVYVIYMQNKVQAITAMKLVQNWGALPALLYFAPTPWNWLGSILTPLYYPIRLFWTSAEGHAEWWLIVPGVALQLAFSALLLRRFQRTVFA